MVHALSEARRALKPGGHLIDLRPTMRNRRVELDLAGATLFLGEIDSSCTFSDHEAANAALDAALAAGDIRLEHETAFAYVTDLDSLADLREFEQGFRRSVMSESIFEQIKRFTADETEDFLIRIRREILIARYQRMPDTDLKNG